MTATIPGVILEKDAKGKPIHLSIDLRQHPEAIPVLKEMGLMPKSDFEKEKENSITPEQLKNSIDQLITTHYGNNH